MCLVQTPYYHKCGHYGNPAIAPYGRCARAEGASGACWEPRPIGFKTVEAMCGSCTRMDKDSVVKDKNSGPGPIDIDKLNQLVKLHKKTCDRRASVASDSPHTASNAALLPTTEELALRIPSTASEISTTSTSTSTMSTKGRPPIVVINQPHHIPLFSAPAWNSAPDQEKHDKKTARNEHASPKSRQLYDPF